MFVARLSIYHPIICFQAGLEGNSLLYEICEKNGIAHKKCRKIIIATDEVEADELEKLYRRGKDNGVPQKMLSLVDFQLLGSYSSGLM